MLKYNNTNIIIVQIPQRYDLANDSRTNLEIQAFNNNLSKIATLFTHVSLIEIALNRKYFTKHGLHLKNSGKGWLTKVIAFQIDKLVRDIDKPEPITVLEWKDNKTNVSIYTTSNHKPKLEITEGDYSQDVLSKVMVSPTQIHNTQGNKRDNELLCKISSRQKKAPLTRSNEFLWHM
jgi:hypothetical protein